MCACVLDSRVIVGVSVRAAVDRGVTKNAAVQVEDVAADDVKVVLIYRGHRVHCCRHWQESTHEN